MRLPRAPRALTAAAALQAGINTLLVIGMVGGASILLFLVNSLLADLSTWIYSSR
jgi:hypothetical protein